MEMPKRNDNALYTQESANLQEDEGLRARCQRKLDLRSTGRRLEETFRYVVRRSSRSGRDLAPQRLAMAQLADESARQQKSCRDRSSHCARKVR